MRIEFEGVKNQIKKIAPEFDLVYDVSNWVEKKQKKGREAERKG